MKIAITICLMTGFLALNTASAQSQVKLDRACEDAPSKEPEPIRKQKIEQCKSCSHRDSDTGQHNTIISPDETLVGNLMTGVALKSPPDYCLAKKTDFCSIII